MIFSDILICHNYVRIHSNCIVYKKLLRKPLNNVLQSPPIYLKTVPPAAPCMIMDCSRVLYANH